MKRLILIIGILVGIISIVVSFESFSHRNHDDRGDVTAVESFSEQK